MLHPILEATATLDVALKSVAEVNPMFMSTEEKSAALRELVRVRTRTTELQLRIMACADDVAEQTAARDAGDWLSHRAHLRAEEARTEMKLARALDRRWHAVATGMCDGVVNLAQAEVISRCLDQLPDDIPADVLARAESTLVGYCGEFGPRQIARLGRHIIATVAPDIAEAAEAKRLEHLESEARRRTRLSMRRQGDGTTRISGLLPDAAAARLATCLEAFTNPRKDQPPAGVDGRSEPERDHTRFGAYPRRLGDAFCELLEAIDPHRLPIHGGDATTLMVTINLDQLRADLATAGILTGTHLPGDDSDLLISAAEARRLACTATIIPVVLGGASEVLDVGRARRLFTPAQRKAMILRDQTCRAEGCHTAGQWCEAHHLHAWATGGRTDHADGALLCAHHHHRAHDPAYRTDLLPDGALRFHRRP